MDKFIIMTKQHCDIAVIQKKKRYLVITATSGGNWQVGK